MADNLSQAEMLSSVAEYTESLGLQSCDPAVRASAEKARTLRVGVKSSAPTTLENMSREQFDNDLNANQTWRYAPGSPVQIADVYLKMGLRPDYATAYGLDEKGQISKADYDAAQHSKALHLNDRAWMGKLAAGDMDATRRWATIGFLIACGARPEATP
jgi:hypothetical protein